MTINYIDILFLLSGLVYGVYRLLSLLNVVSIVAGTYVHVSIRIIKVSYQSLMLATHIAYIPSLEYSTPYQ